jgi:hypothetical protein
MWAEHGQALGQRRALGGDRAATAPEPPKPKGGRPRIVDRAALTGIRFVLKTGLPWADLPQELGCSSGVTCWRRLRISRSSIRPRGPPSTAVGCARSSGTRRGKDSVCGAPSDSWCCVARSSPVTVHPWVRRAAAWCARATRPWPSADAPALGRATLHSGMPRLTPEALVQLAHSGGMPLSPRRRWRLPRRASASRPARWAHNQRDQSGCQPPRGPVQSHRIAGDLRAVWLQYERLAHRPADRGGRPSPKRPFRPSRQHMRPTPTGMPAASCSTR